MILFDNWRIKYVGELLARQYDNLSRTLLVKGVPDGWDWTMMVQTGEYFDVIALAPMEEGVGVVLTEEQLSLDGYYSMQLVGTLKDDGVTKRHTNVLQVSVGQSASPARPPPPETRRTLGCRFVTPSSCRGPTRRTP